jgi:cytoskeletal protein RodZ
MREREQRKLTLEDISTSTKIRIQYLAAIEQECFDQLPGGIIGKGFIRAYARELAMDDQQAIADYLAATEANQSMLDSQQPPEPPIRHDKKLNLATQVPWVVFALALVILVFGFVIVGHYKRSSESQNELSTKSLAQFTAEKKIGPVPRLGNRPGKINTRSDSVATNASAATPPPSFGEFYVRIQAHEDAWLSINVDGKRIMYDTLIATAEETVEGRNLIVIRAGNVGALDFSFNGQNLPKLGEYGEAKTLQFDPNGLQHPAPRSLPTTAASVEQ